MSEEAVIGVNAVTEVLAATGRVNRLYVARESKVRGITTIIELARGRGVRFDFVPVAKLNELAGTREHQGVVAIVSPVEYATLEDCLAACGEQATLLALDQVHHPKNLGLLIRTCAGAGAAGVLIPRRGGALLDSTVVRASAGAVFRIPVVNCGNLAQSLRTLREAGFWVYGLDSDGDAGVFEVDWPPRVVLVVGNETKGLQPTVKKLCDARVRIPLANNLDSLNVAVASGIALFQIQAQHLRDVARATRNAD